MEMSLMEQLMEAYPKSDWPWSYTIGHNISMSYVRNHPFKWKWSFISASKSMTNEDVVAMPISWNYRDFTKKLNIEFILVNLNFHYDWAYVILRMNLIGAIINNSSEITEHIQIWNDAHIGNITENPYLTMELMVANPSLPIMWYSIQFNENVTLQFIDANVDKIPYLKK